MSANYPPQRKIAAHLHTTAGWLTGTFHTPEDGDFLDFLNEEHSFLKLTSARLPGSAKATAFAAVRKSGILTIIPDVPEEELKLRAGVGATERQQISCLLATGLVLGVLETPREVRLSDFLLHQPGFFLLRSCVVYDDRANIRRSSPLALINAEHVAAVEEQTEM